MVQAKLADLGMTRRALSRAIGTSHTYVNKILAGTRLPPLDGLDAWRTALQVRAEDSEAFLEAAALAHCPPAVVDRIATLRRQCAQLQSHVEMLRGQLDQSSRPNCSPPNRMG